MGFGSLAKIIITLQSDSGRSLDDSQAKFLNSAIINLQLMHFRIDWLVPHVEKALALHKNREQVGAIIVLEAKKSKLALESHKAEGRLREVEGKLREVEERLAERRKLVPESLLVTPLDVKDLLS